jgi:hypothetical protein
MKKKILSTNRFDKLVNIKTKRAKIRNSTNDETEEDAADE